MTSTVLTVLVALAITELTCRRETMAILVVLNTVIIAHTDEKNPMVWKQDSKAATEI